MRFSQIPPDIRRGLPGNALPLPDPLTETRDRLDRYDGIFTFGGALSPLESLPTFGCLQVGLCLLDRFLVGRSDDRCEWIWGWCTGYGLGTPCNRRQADDSEAIVSRPAQILALAARGESR